jgi:hypothetical protein
LHGSSHDGATARHHNIVLTMLLRLPVNGAQVPLRKYGHEKLERL